jgi:hypothetical protein
MPLRTQGPLRTAYRRVTVVCLLAMLAGCKPAEQVTKYTAPKDPIDFASISDEPGEGEPAVRILAAIVPTGQPNDWYFFKMQNPPRALERHAAEFDGFIRSLKFSGDGPPAWTVPAGWREIGAQGKDRVTTFRMRKSETVVDLPVTRLGGSLLENINRWRGQVGIDPITEAEIDTKCTVLTVDGRKVVVVDVSGPGGKGGMMPPFAK